MRPSTSWKVLRLRASCASLVGRQRLVGGIGPKPAAGLARAALGGEKCVPAGAIAGHGIGARQTLLEEMALHPAPVFAVADKGMRLQPAVAVAALAAKSKIDGFAEQQRAQLLRGGDLGRPRAGLGAGIGCARRQRPDQPQLGAVVQRHGLAVEDARDCARRPRL